MKFSYKFLIVNFFILLLFLFANMLALKHYAGNNFLEYVKTIKSQTPEFDLKIIDELINNPDVDPEVIKEYQEITKDLSSISSSLENFSKNPKPFNRSLLDLLQKSWFSSDYIEQIISTNALQSFFWNISNLITLDSSTPEWKFVFETLVSLIYFNLILISAILFFVYLWISHSFKPISAIIDNISWVIFKKEYKNIVYKKNDEFKPLINIINNLNRSLSLQEKIRSDFLSDLSHEIKTPITAVKCYLEWIEDGIIELNEKNLWLLRDEIDRLIKITNQVMEFEREESKKFGDIFIEKINLCSLIENMINEYLPILTKNWQQIISYIPDWYNILIDKDKIKQLLHNIFSNFIKYAGKNTSLLIKVYLKANMHVIIFEDNWKWVSSEELPFLKEKFYKAEKSRNKSTDSWIWIGLSVIEKIAKLHWWDYEIDSNIKKWFKIILRIPK